MLPTATVQRSSRGGPRGDADNGLLTTTTTTTGRWSIISSDEAVQVPALDGVRGFAVLLTLLCHVIDGPFVLREGSGIMGVSIFFVLSGFLITGVLLRLQTASSQRRAPYAHLPRFHMDRVVRLFPALVVMLIGMRVLWAAYRSDEPVGINRYTLLALFYLQNIPSLRPRPDDDGPFGQTWSLACEQQFYILWSLALPIVCRLSLRPRALVLGALVVVSLYARVATSMSPGALYGAHWHDSLFTNLFKMAIGAALRLVPVPTFLRSSAFSYVALAGYAIMLLAMLGPRPSDFLARPLPPAAEGVWIDLGASLLTALMLVSLHGTSGRPGCNVLLETKLMRFAGRVSYSCYLWQSSILVWSGWARNWPAIGDTAVAFVLAMLSTFVVEEPLSQYYKTVGKRRAAAAAAISAKE